ncbi:MAG: DNA repair protein RecO [bacterium]
MEPVHTRAFLLRQVDTGESDRVVTLLTEALGKVSAIARGARKSRKRFGAALSLFVLAEAELQRRASSDLYVLTSYDALALHANIGLDIAAIAHASYATELVRELIAKAQPEPGMFGLLLEMYQQLSTEKPSSERLRVLELQLLTHAGLAPQLDSCVGCGQLVDRDSAPIGMDVARGGVLCPGCVTPVQTILPATHAALLQVRGLALGEADSLVVSDAVRRELRATLAEILLHTLGKPLKSVQFIQKLGK